MIILENISYRYNRKEQVLKHLTMHVPKGAIYGFLGSNGAGKSTTIRSILGLLRPQEGSISVLGHSRQRNNVELFQNIGSLVENPSFYPNLSAKDNLRLITKYRSVDDSRIAPTLDRVGLGHVQSKKTAHFSMGMKQRLGLAMAIIHDPSLLILDEPVNGLDPTGISEIRELILTLQQEGKTILLSSHLLSEIEKMATHVGIIQSGALIFEDEIAGLEKLRANEQTIVITSNDAIAAKDALLHRQVEILDNTKIRCRTASAAEIPMLINKLVNSGISIFEIVQERGDLESLFIDLVNSEE